MIVVMILTTYQKKLLLITARANYDKLGANRLRISSNFFNKKSKEKKPRL